MKKLMAIVMAFAIMLTVCACGKNEASKSDAASKNNDSTAAANGESDTSEPNANKGIDTGSMILTKAGAVSGDVSFSHGGIVYKTVGEGNSKRTQILKNNGEAFNDKTYSDIDAIVNYDICTVYNEDENGKRLIGVIDHKNGKEIVPPEASSVSVLSDRFLLLGYETEAGTKDDHFDLYFVNNAMVYYKGYGKILDLEKGQFVPGIEITTSKFDVSAAGNMIFIDKDYPKTDVYTADGKLAGTYEYIYAYPSSDIAMQSTDEGIAVYDKDMKLVSTIATTDISDRYEAVDENSKMLKHEYMKDGKRVSCVTDLSGKALSKDYEKIVSVYDNSYLIVEENGVSKLVDFAGNTIIAGCYKAIIYKFGYISVAFNENGVIARYVYDITGKKISENAADDLFPLLIRDSDDKIICLSTGKPIEAEGSFKRCEGNLVLIDTTVYDVVSGKAVVTDVDDFLMIGDNYYMYNMDSDTYTRYEIEYK